MNLVLFDLDGTLIANKGLLRHEQAGSSNKWARAIREVFHEEIHVDFEMGVVDKQILWNAVQKIHITHTEFEKSIPKLCDAMYHAYKENTKGIDNYETIQAAKNLLDLLIENKRYEVGLLTGNITQIAQYKLKMNGYDDIFKFGLFGEEADDRIALAKSVFTQAKDFFHTDITSSDITVIGDTIHDIVCGKAIGAFTIGVTNKVKEAEEKLKKEGADLVVTSLTDKSVLDYFDIQPV